MDIPDESKPLYTDEDRRRLMARAVNMLTKEFPFVQIIASFDDPIEGGTRKAHAHAGNWHARYGVVMEWLKDRENGDLADELGKAIKPDDGEDWDGIRSFVD